MSDPALLIWKLQQSHISDVMSVLLVAGKDPWKCVLVNGWLIKHVNSLRAIRNRRENLRNVCYSRHSIHSFNDSFLFRNCSCWNCSSQEHTLRAHMLDSHIQSHCIFSNVSLPTRMFMGRGRKPGNPPKKTYRDTGNVLHHKQCQLYHNLSAI